MGYGLKIYNDNGVLIIDGKYRNFSEYTSGSFSPNSNAYTTVSFTATSNLPLVGLQPQELGVGGSVSLIGYTKSGSNWTGFVASSLSISNINYKVYTSDTVNPADTYGLKVYDDSSNIVFHSGKKYFDIHLVDDSVAILPPPFYTNYDITHSDISNPYYFLSPVGYWIYGYVTGPQGPLGFFRHGVQKISSTSVRVGWTRVYGGVTTSLVSAGWNPTINLIVLQ